MIRFRLALTASLLVLVLFAPTPSPAQWVEPPGTGWVDVQVAHQNTGTKFGNQGRRIPLKLSGEARSIITTVRLTGALGIWHGLDVWADVPVRHLIFREPTQRFQRTGISDPRLFVRVGPSLVGLSQLPVAVAVRGGVKLPVGGFAASQQVIPLSEGQRDWKLLLELGKSLHPWPVYVMGWVGYRWREPNDTIARKPGNERLFYAAAGGHVNAFRWKVAMDGLFGAPPVRTAFNLPLENERRELVQILPTVGWDLGPGTVQAGTRIPLHGRNLPAGPTFTLGYFLSWSEPLW